MDGCALSISDGEAKFGFTGGLIARGGLPQYQILTSIAADVVIEIQVTTGEGVSINTEMVLELDVWTGAINPEIVFELLVSSEIGTNPTGPANDNFANRITISGQNAVINASNVGATYEVGEPIHIYDGNSIGTSVWWSWTPITTGTVTMTATSVGFGNALIVYTFVDPMVTDLSLGLLIETGTYFGNGSGSPISFVATAGTTYLIVVTGLDAESGGFTLTLDQI
jgi:hypothetical protein